LEPQELRTLKILEAVDEEESPSQRELARRLNVSLGLVNSFIKRLVNKGYFKVTTIPKNRVKYMLTPTGAAEKTRLTYEYIQYSLQFFKEARRKLRKLYSSLENEGVRRIAFYGAGEFAEIGYLSLQETEIALIDVFDDAKKGKRFFGHKIKGTTDIPDSDFDKILVNVPKNAAAVASKLNELGIPSEKISLME
jgi:DNA-binding MarR family transcriptional regulator